MYKFVKLDLQKLNSFSSEENSKWQEIKDIVKKDDKHDVAGNDYGIYIGTEGKSVPNEYKLRYLINQNTVLQDNYCDVINGKGALFKALSLAKQDLLNVDKKVLLYLGKFPGYGFDIDGGSILARQLIDLLKRRCQLDIMFIRKNNEVFEDAEVKHISYVKYLDAFNNKFIRRLENLKTNQEALKNYRDYDYIITAHISKFFGMQDAGYDFWGKTILFPMFCTSSYKRAGEVVPREYTFLEKKVIDSVGKVITPSRIEAEDLVRDYSCRKEKVVIIPRSISPLIHFHYRKSVHNPIRLVCIGSIKKQKNTIEAIKLVEHIENMGQMTELHLVCTIQEPKIYDTLKQYIESKDLTKKIFFHIAISQKELSLLLEKMDINVSVSKWETFGRGIFEGASAGIPTFCLNGLREVKQYCCDSEGIVFLNSIEEMAAKIVEIGQNIAAYEEMVNKLPSIINKFSFKKEQQALLKEIFS